MIMAKVVGAGGYGGVGIIELLVAHPEAGIAALVSTSEIGKPISEVYPHLDGFCDIPITAPDDADSQLEADVVFYATPDRVGMTQARAELERGARIIDYSGDFRFNDTESYAGYAGRIGKDTAHADPDLLDKAVYGLAELHRDKIREANIVGNPGCFAVSCILGLAPAVRQGLVENDSIICDCKTGVSGAGKKANPAHHYPARYDNMNAYKLAGHQHVFEIERELSLVSGSDVRVTFTAQVVPVCRGIMSVLYGRVKGKADYEQILDTYREFYKDSCFVHVLDNTATIGTAHVRGTNFCKLIVDFDERTGCLRVVSHIDNLIKGQAGSALQCMNIMFGLPEDTGFHAPPKYP